MLHVWPREYGTLNLEVSSIFTNIIDNVAFQRSPKLTWSIGLKNPPYLVAQEHAFYVKMGKNSWLWEKLSVMKYVYEVTMLLTSYKVSPVHCHGDKSWNNHMSFGQPKSWGGGRCIRSATPLLNSSARVWNPCAAIANATPTSTCASHSCSLVLFILELTCIASSTG